MIFGFYKFVDFYIKDDVLINFKIMLIFQDLSYNNLKEVLLELEKVKNCIVLNIVNNK